MPQFSEDDYIDYCVCEALTHKSYLEEENQIHEQKAKEWSKSKTGFDDLRSRVE